MFELLKELLDVVYGDYNNDGGENNLNENSETITKEYVVNSEGVCLIYTDYGISDLDEITEKMFIDVLNEMYFKGFVTDKENRDVSAIFVFPKIDKKFEFKVDDAHEFFVIGYCGYGFKYDVVDGKFVFIGSTDGRYCDEVNFIDVVRGIKQESEIKSAIDKFIERIDNADTTASGTYGYESDNTAKEKDDEDEGNKGIGKVYKKPTLAFGYKNALERRFEFQFDTWKMTDSVKELDMTDKRIVPLFAENIVVGFRVPLYMLDNRFPCNLTQDDYKCKFNANSDINRERLNVFADVCEDELGFDYISVLFDEHETYIGFYFKD